MHEALEGLDFPECFIEWAMFCITTSSYSVVRNGGLEGFFVGKRAFVVCIEVLSRIMSTAERDKQFTYHPKCLL